LVSYLKGQANEDFLRAYYAAATIARVQSSAKPRAWWAKQDAPTRRQEIIRFRGIIEKKIESPKGR